MYWTLRHLWLAVPVLAHDAHAAFWRGVGGAAHRLHKFAAGVAHRARWAGNAAHRRRFP